MTVTAFEQPVDDAHRLGTELTNIIRDAALNHPRSKQRHLGPSEIGEPCTRRLAYRLLEWAQPNHSSDPWKPFVGTAVHAALAPIFDKHNEQLGRVRWLVETPVAAQNAPAGSGTADLYDVDTGTVIDWKIVGPSSMTHYRQHGPGPRYRTQLHTYGRGFTRAGHDVRRVAIVFLPQSGYLAGHHVWTEPYDETVATDALARVANTIITADVLDLENHPERFGLIPAAPSHACIWCPWFNASATADRAGCPGEMAKDTAA